MKRWGVLVLLATLGVCVCGLYLPSSPYGLNYKHIAINTPVEYSKYLEDKTYPSGEKYLAEDMVYTFNKLGYEAKVYALEDSYSNRNFKEGYEIYLRLHPEMLFDDYHKHLDKDRIAVVYETLNYSTEQLKNADIVFTGSKKKNEEYKKAGINSFYVPQFTRLDKFYYSPKEELKTDVLFVGNQWNINTGLRKSIQYGLLSGMKIDVYGKGWEKLLPQGANVVFKGKQIKGGDLKHYYSSAKIVLNDTHQFMLDNGFIPNRVFDVTASKGFLISDYNEAIEKIYGDAIPMYKNEQEFKELIEYYLSHPEERKEKAERAYEITKNNFNAQKVIGEMIRIMEDYRQKNIKPETFWKRLKFMAQKVTGLKQKNVAIRINLRKQLVDYNMFSAIEYLKFHYIKKGYKVHTLFGGNLYNPVADAAEINVFIRGNGPFLDARINKDAKNLYFVLNSEHIFPEELNNFDEYLVNSNEFLSGLKVFKTDDIKLLFGSAYHELLAPEYEYDVLFISDSPNSKSTQYINLQYKFKAYTGTDFAQLSDKEKENELCHARLVIYEANPYTFENNVGYAVLNIISYGRPVLTDYSQILKSTFKDDVETFESFKEMSEKIDMLLNEDTSVLEEKAKRARLKLIEITNNNEIF